MADVTFGPKAYKTSDGDKQVIASGGSLAVESGGDLDLESGANFKLAGVATIVSQSSLTASTTSAADSLAIPITAQVVSKTTGADAEALTLADGTAGQILVIVLTTDGGGVGTLTPTSATGWATCVFADAGDTLALIFVDATVGWLILGTAGVAAPPVISV